MRRPGRATGVRRTAAPECRGTRLRGSPRCPSAPRFRTHRQSGSPGRTSPGWRRLRPAEWSRSSDVGSREDGRGDRIEWATAGIEVLDVFVAEVLDRRGHRAGRAITEGTERPPENVVGHVEQGFDVLLVALTAFETFKNLYVPEHALAARRALATRLMR